MSTTVKELRTVLRGVLEDNLTLHKDAVAGLGNDRTRRLQEQGAVHALEDLLTDLGASGVLPDEEEA